MAHCVRVDFKIAVLVFQCLNGKTLVMVDDCQLAADARHGELCNSI